MSETFARERLALEPVDSTRWRVHYRSFVIGSLDTSINKSYEASNVIVTANVRIMRMPGPFTRIAAS